MKEEGCDGVLWIIIGLTMNEQWILTTKYDWTERWSVSVGK